MDSKKNTIPHRSPTRRGSESKQRLSAHNSPQVKPASARSGATGGGVKVGPAAGAAQATVSTGVSNEVAQVTESVRRTRELFRTVAASRTLKYKSNEVVVSSGSRFQFPIRVEQSGASVKWKFQVVKGGDIAFSIVAHLSPASRTSRSDDSTDRASQDGDSSSESGAVDSYSLASDAASVVADAAAERSATAARTCVDLGRVGSGNALVEGSVQVPAGAEQLFLVWDNSFSWWTPKTLRYSVHLLYGGRGGKKSASSSKSGPASSAATLASVGAGNGVFDANRISVNEQRRNELLVTLCTVMRQLDDNQQKLQDLERWFITEQQALQDLQAKHNDLEAAFTIQKATEQGVLDRESQLQGTMNALLLRGLSQRAKRKVLGFLSAKDLRAWKCTTPSWKEFWQ